jgi:hypothetical protein
MSTVGDDDVNDPNVQDDGLFSTFGTVRVNIVEINDVLDYIESKQSGQRKKKSKTKGFMKYWVFACIGICEEGEFVKRFDSTAYPAILGETSNIVVKEEYMFDVSSSNTLTISLFAFVKYTASGLFESSDSSPICNGHFHLPIYRLEEGAAVKISKIFK